MKDELTTFYEIILINNNFKYVALDNKGNHILVHKTEPRDVSLVFRSEEKAREYINKNLDAEKYTVEMIGLNESYYTNIPK